MRQCMAQRWMVHNLVHVAGTPWRFRSFRVFLVYLTQGASKSVIKNPGQANEESGNGNGELNQAIDHGNFRGALFTQSLGTAAPGNRPLTWTQAGAARDQSFVQHAVHCSLKKEATTASFLFSTNPRTNAQRQFSQITLPPTNPLPKTIRTLGQYRARDLDHPRLEQSSACKRYQSLRCAEDNWLALSWTLAMQARRRLDGGLPFLSSSILGRSLLVVKKRCAL
jgi:hypothetical protein